MRCRRVRSTCEARRSSCAIGSAAAGPSVRRARPFGLLVGFGWGVRGRRRVAEGACGLGNNWFLELGLELRDVELGSVRAVAGLAWIAAL